MDELGEIIDELQCQALATSDPLRQLQAKLLHRLAVALVEDRKLKRQTVRAIAANLRTQRLVRQAIGRPRKPKGPSHGKKTK